MIVYVDAPRSVRLGRVAAGSGLDESTSGAAPARMATASVAQEAVIRDLMRDHTGVRSVVAAADRPLGEIVSDVLHVVLERCELQDRAAGHPGGLWVPKMLYGAVTSGFDGRVVLG